MLHRKEYIENINETFEIFPICALLGPRQCGKTTLANTYAQLFQDEVHTFDLEDPEELALLANPKLALGNLKGLIVIDEIQRSPDLFQYLRVLVDRNKNIKLLILGSASRELIKQSSESLAGRIRYLEMQPFNVKEAGEINTLWHRGGYPRSYLANDGQGSSLWRNEYIQTFLERDLSLLGFNLSPQLMRKLWTMIAHYHGNILNYSEFSRSLGINDKTVKAYIDALEGAFMVRILKPWFANIKKRQIKSPKIYIRDSGILHSLLRIEDQDLAFHPKVGASWEGFILEQIISLTKIDAADCYYWRTNAGAELDLLIQKKNKLIGFEIKYTDSPRVTPSMYSALDDLEIDQIHLIIPGNAETQIHDKVYVQGAALLPRLIL